MKSKISILCLLILTLLINALVFANSFEDVAQSHEKSNAVTGVVESVVNEQDETEWQLNMYIRKFAHIFEFALLGITVALCLYLVKRCYSKRFYGFGCFYVLAIAVLDEYIQSFSNRTSSVKDILLDFSGFIIGSVVVLIGVRVFLIVRKLKEKRETREIV